MIFYRWGDYEKLEGSHKFIQWLFPNFYGSDHNSDSHILAKHEAEIFRNDIEVYIFPFIMPDFD